MVDELLVELLVVDRADHHCDSKWSELSWETTIYIYMKHNMKYAEYGNQLASTTL